jgi:hypothetical protein
MNLSKPGQAPAPARIVLEVGAAQGAPANFITTRTIQRVGSFSQRCTIVPTKEFIQAGSCASAGPDRSGSWRGAGEISRDFVTTGNDPGRRWRLTRLG